MEDLIKELFGSYGWLFISGFLALVFKDAIANLWKGLLVFWGSDINLDDIVYYKGRKARVVRKGVFKTVIYLSKNGSGVNTAPETKIVITNSELKSGDIEILLDYDYDKTD